MVLKLKILGKRLVPSAEKVFKFFSMNSSTITLDVIKKYHKYSPNIDKTINWALDQNLKYPKRLNKPILKKEHSVEDLEEYTKKFKTYINQKINYDKYLKKYKDRVKEIEYAIIEFIKTVSGFYDHIPKNNQEKAWMKAWEDGHSSGMYSVFQELEELVDLFTD